MARIQIDVQTLTSAYPITADGADVPTFEAMDATEGNYYRATGREVFLVRNTSEDTALDFTIKGQPDAIGRTADTVHEIAFGTEAMYFIGTKGYRKANRTTELDTEDPGLDEEDVPLPGLEIAIVRLPTA